MSNSRKSIAVAGAAGQPGAAAVRALQAGGQFKARALMRAPAGRPGDQVVEADRDRPQALEVNVAVPERPETRPPERRGAPKRILVVTSSPRIASYSTQVARALAQRLAARAPGSSITVRDLAREPLPHIDDSFAAARGLPPESLTPGQKASLVLSDTLLEELFAADTLIMAVAMINFAIPSNLKAYIDHIVRPRVTFRYSDKGPEGLVKGKKVYLVVARGGVYSEGPMQRLNFQDTYLRVVLPFIGLDDIELITVEGVALGPGAADKAVGAALAQVDAMAT